METGSTLLSYFSKVAEYLLLLAQNQKENFQKICSYGLQIGLARRGSNKCFIREPQTYRKQSLTQFRIYAPDLGYRTNVHLHQRVEAERTVNKNNCILSTLVTLSPCPSFRNSPAFLVKLVQLYLENCQPILITF